MTDKEDSTLKVMTRAMKSAVEHSAKNIKTVTRNLENRFEGLDAHQLPEYQKALDAIRAYQSAFVEHFTKKYNEFISQKNSIN